MIPDKHKEDVIQSGINFLRSITEAFGSEEGMQLWERIAEVVDPDIKGHIFFALLTGEYNGIITISGCAAHANRVGLIKAVRSVTDCGLKQAKDQVDLMLEGKPQRLKVNPRNRNKYLTELRDAGFYV